MRRVTALALVVAGCGGGLRTAPTGPHAEGAPRVEVTEPPPPAKVEVVPADPGGSCVWVDGYWELEGRSWSWTDGGWYVAPKGCYRAGPEVLWEAAGQRGRLRWAAPRWYPTRGTGECRRPAKCSVPRSAERGDPG